MRTKSSKQITNFLNSSALTRPLIALGAASVLFGSGSARALDSNALPQNPTVTGGKATFAQSGNTLNVNQSTNRTIIDWRSFNIGSKAQTNFNQPNAGSIAVNRVNGSANPSDIEGGLHANGQVWILNPNGVFFGKNARVDAAGIIASTANIDDKAFMAGSNKLQMTGADHGFVENQGNITVGASGLAAFVAPSVRNSGTINATVGKVTLAAGTTYTLDLAGDHMVELGLGSVKAVVDNSGKIVNPGGTITLTAKAAGQVVDSVVNVSGIVSASSVTKSGGTIVLGGDNVTTTKTAQLSADAGTNGDGGTITSVADNQGNYAGTFSAKGGSASGNGGKIETSGKSVHVDDGIKVNTLASNGATGSWTLDPDNLTVQTGGSGAISGTTNDEQSTIDPSTVVTALGTTDVTLQANVSISIESAIDASGNANAHSLTLADQDGGGLTLNLDAPITLKTGGNLSGDGSVVNVGSGGLIQNGIDAAAIGATVNLAAATYALSSGVSIATDGITLQGVSGTIITDGGSTSGNAINISGGNVTVQGFEIDLNPTGSAAINGVNIAGTADSATVTGLTIRGEVTGSYVDYAFGNPVSRGVAVKSGATNFAISDNDIENIRTGILVDGAASTLNTTPTNSGTITGNLIDNTKGGLLINYTDGTGITITGNRQGTAGNEWGEIWHLQGTHTGTASSGVQSGLLAASTANNGWTVEDQAYAQSNRTAVTVAASATNANSTPSDSNQGSYRSPLSTIQAGVNAVVDGGVVNVLGGNYTLTGELDITKSLSLIGAGVGVTNITSTSTGYGVFVDADNTTLSGFTYNGSSAGSYSFKIQAAPGSASNRLLNFDIDHVTINGSKKTGLDLNGVDGATIDNVSVNNTTNGDGMALTDSANVVITNSTTTGNAWGGLAINQTNHYYDQQTSDITVDATNSFGESNPVFLQDESIGSADPNSVVGGTGLDFGSNIDIEGFGYAVKNSSTLSEANTYTWLQKTQQNAVDFAMSLTGITGSSTVQDWTGTGTDQTFTVGTSGGNAMSIQAAVNAATNGATIDVLAGTYSEAVNINKSLTLDGANAGINAADGTGTAPAARGAETILSHNGFYAFDVNATNVTIDGFEFTGGNGRLIDWASASNIDGLTIKNNIFNLPSGPQDAGVIQLAGTGTANNVDIANNLFEGSGFASSGDVSSNWLYVGGTAANGFSGLTLTGNDFTGGADNAVFQASPAFDGLNISNNYFGHALIEGLNMGSLIDPTISGNTFVGVQFAAMQIGTTSGGTISYNTIDGTGSGYNISGTLYADGIDVWGGEWGTGTSNGLVIQNNTIENYKDTSPLSTNDRFAGIYLRPDAGPVTITNNTIENNTTGLLANTATTGSTVTGNTFSDNDTHVLDKKGVFDLTAFAADNTLDRDVWITGGNALFGNIQTGVNAATGGDTVNVGAGTYEEQVVIDKGINLVGSGEGTTTIEAPDTLSHSFTAEGNAQHAIVSVENTSGVTISGLTVDGLGKGDANGHLIGIGFYDASGTVDGVHVTNIYDAANSGNQEGYGVAVYTDNTTGQAVTVENSTLDHIQKNAIAFRGEDLFAFITGNTITGAGDTPDIAQNGVELYDNLSGGQTVSGIISGNTISGFSYVVNGTNSPDYATSVYLINTEDVLVADNTVTGTGTGAASYGVSALGSDNLTLADNSLSDLQRGISLYDQFYGSGGSYASFGPDSGVTITGGSLSGNDTGLFTNSTYVSGLHVSGVDFSNNDIQFTGSIADLANVLANNTFDATAVDANVGDTIYGDLQTAIGDANSGDTLDVAGTFTTNGQVAITQDLTIAGDANARATINSGTDQTSGNAASAWFLVDPNVTFNLSNVVIDGTGHTVYQALRNEGDTTVDNVDFRNIGDASAYVGEAIESFGGHVVGGAGSDSNPAGSAAASLTVTNSTFENIGRIGVLVKGDASTANITGITYTGKGDGDWLDYGVEFGAGGSGTVSDSTITGATGIASDGSTSAGIQVTTFYGSGTNVTIDNNVISGSYAAVDVGYDSADTSVVHASNNDFAGNTHGVELESSLATADFSGNWWGTTDASAIEASMTGADASSVDFSPFLMSGTDTDAGTAGFQGDYSNLTVTTLGGGGSARIEEGVADANAGGTVNVLDGSYTLAGELDINKSLSLLGQSEAGVDITSNSTNYGIYVTGNDVSLQNFTYHGPTATGPGGTYGIKVDPGTNVATDRLTGFDIENVTIDRGYRTGLDLNGVDGATIHNVSVSNIANGNGIALTDSADVTITNSTTTNNAWGGLALYQTNYYYDQQVNNITVDGTNTFNEANGIYIEDQSDGVGTLAHPSVVGGSGLDVGTLNIAGYDFVAVDKSNSADQYTFFQNGEQDAIDFATDSTLNGGHLTLTNTYVQGWTGTALDNNFYVGTGANFSQLLINTAVNAASTGDTINVDAGTYAESVSVPKQLEFDFGGTGVTVNDFALTSGSAGSTLNGKLTATSGDISATDAVNLNGTFEGKGFSFGGGVTLMGDTTIQSTAFIPGPSNDIASVTGNGYDLTVNTSTGSSLGEVDGLGALDVVGSVTLTGATYTANSENFESGITLSNDVTLDTSAANGDVFVVVSATGNGHDLTIDTGTGNTSLGNVSGVRALLVDGTSTLTGTSYMAESEEFDGAVELSGDTTLDTSGAGGDITVASVTGNGNGLTVNAGSGNTTLGDISGAGAVALNSAATVNGDVTATSFTANGTLGLTGNLSATGAVALNGASTITGDVAADSFTTGDTLALNGDLTSSGAVELGGAANITGNVQSGDFSANGKLTLNGDLDSTGAVALDDAATIVGDVTADAFTAGNTLSLTGDLTSAGAVDLGGAANITGNVQSADFTAEGKLTLGGNLTASGDAVFGGASVVNGDITAAAITAKKAFTLDGNATAAGAIALNGAATLSGDLTGGSIALDGATTLTGDTTLDTSAANGAISVASVDGTTAGGQSLSIDAGTGDVSLGDAGASTRLGALTDVSDTTLTGKTYSANNVTFGGDITLTRSDTTIDTSAAAGDIAFNGDVFGTANGKQSLTLIAGPGTGSASANGDITLQNAGTSSVRLKNMTVSGNNFTALTVWLAGNFNSTLTGNQVFAADTLHAGGDVTSDVGGNASGHIDADGDVTLTAGGDISGTIGGQNVTLTADDVNATVTAANAAVVQANTIEGAYTGNTVSLSASNSVNANVNAATTFDLVSPTGSVTGSWTSIDTTGSGSIDVNGQQTLGHDGVNPNQLVVEGFTLPAGTTIGANGQLILPQGVLLGLLSPGGGKPKMILVHSVQQLGELLASGYTVIVIDLKHRGNNEVELASN